MKGTEKEDKWPSHLLVWPILPGMLTELRALQVILLAILAQKMLVPEFGAGPSG